jgi:general secretion pathway protein J
VSPTRPVRTRRRIAPLPDAARRGLTLVEVMVAIAIMLITTVLSTAVIANSLELRQILEDRDATTRAARVAMSTLSRDVELAYLTRTPGTWYQTVFVGLDGSTDALYLTTRSHQRLYRDSRESDQAEITIWAEPSRDARGYTLYRRESAPVDERPDEGGAVYPIAHGVRSFELRYLDGQTDEWRTEWDTRGVDTPNRLPRAVQIGLVLIGVDPEDSSRTVDIPFFTTVLLTYADPLPREDGLGGAVQALDQAADQRNADPNAIDDAQRRAFDRFRGIQR